MLPTILSQNQLHTFFSEGYLQFNDFIPKFLLEKLRHFFDKEMNNDIDIPGKVSLTKNGNKSSCPML